MKQKIPQATPTSNKNEDKHNALWSSDQYENVISHATGTIAAMTTSTEI